MVCGDDGFVYMFDVDINVYINPKATMATSEVLTLVFKNIDIRDEASTLAGAFNGIDKCIFIRDDVICWTDGKNGSCDNIVHYAIKSDDSIVITTNDEMKKKHDSDDINVTWKQSILCKHSSYIRSMSYNNTNMILALGCDDGNVYLYDMQHIV